MFKKKKRIFISYAREDSEIADLLYYFLKNNGFSPWMDRSNLKVGDDWERTTRKELRLSDFIIPLLSSVSVKKEGFVKREFFLAVEANRERKTPILPIRVDNCAVTSDFSHLQIIDWSIKGQEELLQRLKKRGRRGYLFTKWLILLSIIFSGITIASITAKVKPVSTRIKTSILDSQTNTQIDNVLIIVLSLDGDTLAKQINSRINSSEVFVSLAPGKFYKVVFDHPDYYPAFSVIDLTSKRTSMSVDNDTLVEQQKKMIRAKNYTLIGYSINNKQFDSIYSQTGFILTTQSNCVIDIDCSGNMQSQAYCYMTLKYKGLYFTSRNIVCKRNEDIISGITSMLNELSEKHYRSKTHKLISP